MAESITEFVCSGPGLHIVVVQDPAQASGVGEEPSKNHSPENLASSVICDDTFPPPTLSKLCGSALVSSLMEWSVSSLNSSCPNHQLLGQPQTWPSGNEPNLRGARRSQSFQSTFSKA